MPRLRKAAERLGDRIGVRVESADMAPSADFSVATPRLMMHEALTHVTRSPGRPVVAGLPVFLSVREHPESKRDGLSIWHESGVSQQVGLLFIVILLPFEASAARAAPLL